ncbi:capsid [Common carp toti-like virus 1]|uniref:Capsid n=1 Tax=Common carp toti-like virus 1 TaxID=2855314 RepID=A0A8F5GJ82_9VIRU|nr:capsid [Common carp toti-like virus 1]
MQPQFNFFLRPSRTPTQITQHPISTSIYIPPTVLGVCNVAFELEQMKIANSRESSILRLPGGRGGLSVLIQEFATNLESIARAIFTDTNMLIEPSIQDRENLRQYQIFREGNVDSLNAAVAVVAAEREYTNTSTTHVPGPTARVLFVVVDQTNERMIPVRVQGAAGLIELTPAANYVIGGADMDLAPVINRNVNLGADAAGLEQVACWQRWVEYFGNEEDWQSALELVSNAYVTFTPEMRRHTNRVEGGFYWQVGAAPPFGLGNMANWVRVDNLAPAARVVIYNDSQNMLSAPWGGYRVRGLAPDGIPNMMYTRYEPVLGVGSAGLMWRPEHPVLAPIFDRVSALADVCYQRGRMCAVFEDIAVGQMGLAEDTIAQANVAPNAGLVQRVLKKVQEVENSVLTAKHQSTVMVMMGGYFRIGGAVAHQARYPQSAPGTMRKRIPVSQWRGLGFEWDLPGDDLYSIGSGEFEAVNATIGALGGIWDVIKYKLPVPGEDGRGVMGITTAIGGWTRAQTNVDNVGTIRESGLEPEPEGIVMSTPTRSRALYLRWGLFAVPPLESSTREYPYAGYSRSMTPTNHMVMRAVSGGRSVVLKGSRGQHNPVFVNRTPGQPTTNTPQVDTQGTTTEAFLDL